MLNDIWHLSFLPVLYFRLELHLEDGKFSELSAELKDDLPLRMHIMFLSHVQDYYIASLKGGFEGNLEEFHWTLKNIGEFMKYMVAGVSVFQIINAMQKKIDVGMLFLSSRRSLVLQKKKNSLVCPYLL